MTDEIKKTWNIPYEISSLGLSIEFKWPVRNIHGSDSDVTRFWVRGAGSEGMLLVVGVCCVAYCLCNPSLSSIERIYNIHV